MEKIQFGEKYEHNVTIKAHAIREFVIVKEINAIKQRSTLYGNKGKRVLRGRHHRAKS